MRHDFVIIISLICGGGSGTLTSWSRSNTANHADRNINLWDTPTHALEYLARADRIPYRGEGERTLLECLPPSIGRVLDLGSGDGRLLGLDQAGAAGDEAVAIDFSETMLDRLRERFAEDPRVRVVAHDLSEPLPEASLGRFDAIVSSFAIHHVTHPRKRELYAEIHRLLSPAASSSISNTSSRRHPSLHHQFLASTERRAGRRGSVEQAARRRATQLGWMRTIGFADVDRLWKWRELALLAAGSLRDAPSAPTAQCAPSAAALNLAASRIAAVRRAERQRLNRHGRLAAA